MVKEEENASTRIMAKEATRKISALFDARFSSIFCMNCNVLSMRLFPA
ncbi:hypothetical protein [Anaplasma centrale]|nr:hypothetical protein [Anaplasma centrale]